MLASIKMHICHAVPYFGLVWADLLRCCVSSSCAEVGVAPCLLQPAHLADEFFFLRGRYLYQERLLPFGAPRRQRPSQQNMGSPSRGGRTDAVPWGESEVGSRIWRGCYQPGRCLSVFKHPFIYASYN